ncbi:MAG: hypothetical protein BWZ08_01049 [candidate division BRC1 bacterium ADurb.BinA292]|nr:MAG: hypothetical protein BWZ08_01049 [candidate division BRC1 bacterium ADurb.BinA292]
MSAERKKLTQPSDGRAECQSLFANHFAYGEHFGCGFIAGKPKEKRAPVLHEQIIRAGHRNSMLLTVWGTRQLVDRASGQLADPQVYRHDPQALGHPRAIKCQFLDAGFLPIFA